MDDSLETEVFPPSTDVETDGVDERNATYFPMLKQPVVTAILFASSYGLVFLVGVIGNVTVVFVVVRNPRLQNVTNCFIVNLAVADLLVILFCLPANLVSNLFAGWHLGSAMCKIVPFLQGVSVAASASTLTAISIDRYLAICHPLKRCLTKGTVRNTIAAIWVLSSVTISPWLFSYTLVDSSSPYQTIYVCHDSSTPLFIKVYFFGVIFLICYSVPLVCISVFYTLIAHRVWNRNTENMVQHNQAIYSSKIKVLKMLITVVILFAVFWMPLYAIHMKVLFDSERHDPFLQQTLVPIAQWLSSSNSSVNPLVYCLFSKKFRTAFASTCMEKKHANQNAAFAGSRWASHAKSVNFTTQGRRTELLQMENRDKSLEKKDTVSCQNTQKNSNEASIDML